MPAMRFVAIQHEIDWERPAATRRRILDLIPPRSEEVGVLLLPELCETGFSLNLDVVADLEADGRTSEAWAAQLAADRGEFVQIGHAVRAPDGRGLNRATILGPDGSTVGRYDKIHPFTFADEDRVYAPGRRVEVFECGGLRICPLVCYDLRFPEIWRHGVRAGAEVFTIGASWPAKRQHHWRTLLIARAIENQAYVVACNRVGRDPAHEYAGGSMIVSPTGEILAEGDAKPAAVAAAIDHNALLEWRRTFPALRDLQSRWLDGDRTESHSR